ncbi:MAG: transcriptional regulator [Kineosporiaceae bacterium]|nr:transcriptional regulator [Aeromicrobium sp.]
MTSVVGTHPNTLRGHLDTLTNAGLIAREGAPISGRGRPSWLYRATPAGKQQGHEYAGLATALAGQLERSSLHPQDEAISAGEKWGKELAEAAPPVEGVRHQLITLLDELGFSPESDRSDGAVRLRSCPMIEVAQQHPDVVCGVHKGMIRGILKNIGGDPESTELLAFYEPDACHLHFRDDDPDHQAADHQSAVDNQF